MPHQPTVAVVIPCYEQKRFLRGAIDSVLRQTVPASEIIVVDDGSSEELSSVVSEFHEVTLIRQANRGLAGARNTGLKASRSEKIIFLDADDQLLPRAIELGLEAFHEHPDAAFVYGGFWVVRNGERSPGGRRATSHRDLIQCNWVGMIAAAMFDRERLLEVGAFDESLGMCEDWDAYLRLSRSYAFHAFGTPVADYVKHESNASNDLPMLMRWIEAVREKEKGRGLDPDDEQAWLDGRRIWREMLGIDNRWSMRRAVKRFARSARWPFSA